MKAIAPTGHVPSSRPPIRVRIGEVVTVGERDTEWPAFVMVTSGSGQGWVPARYLSTHVGEATVVTAYDTTELAVAAGAEVSVTERDDESGWWWCEDDAGGAGWVPQRALVLID